MHPPFQARNPVTSSPALPGTGYSVILVQCCRALSGPSDGALPCLNPVPADYGLFGLRISAFGFTAPVPPATSPNPRSSPPQNSLPPFASAALQARCKRDAHAMLACCYRILFVFSSCFLRVLFVFLFLSPVGSACLPQRRCRYACALSFWLHSATFALADWQERAILNG